MELVLFAIRNSFFGTRPQGKKMREFKSRTYNYFLSYKLAIRTQ